MPQQKDQGTVLLIHGDGMVDDTTIKDQCGNAITNTSVTLSTAQKEFGSTSMYFNGSAKLEYPNNTLLDNANFSVDLFIRTANASNVQIPLHLGGQSNGFGTLAIVITSGTIYSAMSQNGTSWALTTDSVAISSNTWYHYEINRIGNTFRDFLNGNLINAYTLSGALYNSGLANVIGSERYSSPRPLTGYITELRITNNPIHTAGFTVPTMPYNGRRGWY